tara:strand:- start:49636 stop:50814 length:1179 start_codon:yes stop_codon:yes gene_type:complete
MISNATSLESTPGAVPIVAPVQGSSRVDNRVSELENEVNCLAFAMSQRFEELSLIHDLTDRLNLEADLAAICDSLLDQLSGCIGAETIAIDLFGDEDAAIEPKLFHTGRPFERDWIDGITETYETGATVTIANDWKGRAGHSIRVVVVRIDHRQGELGRMIAVRSDDAVEFGTIEGDLMKSTSMMLGMHIANQRQYAEMQQMFEGTIQSLVSALDAKDAYTCGHSTRVSELAVELATRLGYDADRVATIRMGGILHDIGKIGVDDSVLRKPGRLTDEEFEQIKQHPVLGYEILRGIRQFRDILPAVRHHHESWDGSGYPDGLAGDMIPRDAQIMAVADAFDAMTSDRPYRSGLALDKVVGIFESGRGSQWAADVVDALLAAPEVMERYARKE